MSYKTQLQEYLSMVEIEKTRSEGKERYYRSMLIIEQNNLRAVNRLIKTIKADIKKEKA